jgi:chitosanase
MNLTPKQKVICEQVINVFETGSVQGNYSAISIFNDGPHRMRQVTYGRSQTTEFGNLHALVDMYVEANGMFSEQLRPYVDKIGMTSLVDDDQFKQLLRDAGKKDPKMREIQDRFFDKVYFAPAMSWAATNGFILPLSALVIYDSFIHSGSMPDFLRKRFSERPPAQGGNEKQWITQYVQTRDTWLANHSNPDLHPTVYRTQCFTTEIKRGNWDLSQLPIVANKIKVMGATT